MERGFHCLILIVFGFYLHFGFIGGSSMMTGVHFQNERMITKTTFLNVPPPAFTENHTELTLCMRFFWIQETARSCLISYHLDDKFGQDLYLCLDSDEKLLRVMMKAFSSPIDIKMKSLKRLRWHNICLCFHLEKKIAYVAHQETRETLILPINETSNAYLRAGGRLVIGTDIDSIEGSYDISEAFVGEMADLLIMNISLSSEDIERYMNCKPLPMRNEALYDLEKSDSFEISGAVNYFNISKEFVCEKQKIYVYFPVRKSFNEADQLCQSYNGYLAIPESRKEHEYLSERFQKYYDVCENSWSGLFWLGLEGNITGKYFFNMYSKNSLVFNNFSESWWTPTPRYACASVSNKQYKYAWYSTPCNLEICVLCSIEQNIEVKIKGLCKKSKFDTSYFMYGLENNKPAFIGQSTSMIIHSDKNWIMQNRHEENVTATIDTEIPIDFPFGLHTWLFRGDVCQSGPVVLIITACSEDEFTCHSHGKCIPMEKRCDLSPDCSDNSDELGCNAIHKAPGHNNQLAPPPIDHKNLYFYFSMSIISIRQFSLSGFFISFDAHLNIIWKDPRLSFATLKSYPHVNRVRLEEIWLPPIHIEDGFMSPAEIIERGKSLTIIKESEALPDDISTLIQDRYYSGSYNSLSMTQKLTIKTMCQFQLTMYPFDYQKCRIVLNIMDESSHYKLAQNPNATAISFKGEKRLLEYYLMNVDMKDAVHDDVHSQEVTITFRNLYFFYLGNAFLPSFLLVIICYSVFYYDLQDFQNRIMVSLTSLLVLASLFSQSSESIPKTSYLKLIDVWYIVLIVFDFCIIIDVVVIEVMRLKQITIVVKPSFLRAELQTPNFEKMNQQSKIVFPTILVCFLVCFFTIGFVNVTS